MGYNKRKKEKLRKNAREMYQVHSKEKNKI